MVCSAAERIKTQGVGLVVELILSIFVECNLCRRLLLSSWSFRHCYFVTNHISKEFGMRCDFHHYLENHHSSVERRAASESEALSTLAYILCPQGRELPREEERRRGDKERQGRKFFNHKRRLYICITSKVAVQRWRGRSSDYYIYLFEHLSIQTGFNCTKQTYLTILESQPHGCNSTFVYPSIRLSNLLYAETASSKER